MDQMINDLNDINQVIEQICVEVKKDNYENITELIHLLQKILPFVFSIDTSIRGFEDKDILEMLTDVVNSYENKDSVLMIDILKYGLASQFSNLIERLS